MGNNRRTGQTDSSTDLVAILFARSKRGGGQNLVLFKGSWWTRGDSNPRPPRCERGALPAELLAHEQQTNFSKHLLPCQHTVVTLETNRAQKAAL